MTPVKSAARLHGRTASSGEEESGLLTDRVRNGLFYFSEFVQILGGQGNDIDIKRGGLFFFQQRLS